jgi:hypothetical protein
MTLQQLAKQLNIPVKKLERDSLKAFLLTKLGENEARRHKLLKKYQVENAKNWDEKAREGKAAEGGYGGIVDYFNLDTLDFEKEELIRQILSF